MDYKKIDHQVSQLKNNILVRGELSEKVYDIGKLGYFLTEFFIPIPTIGVTLMEFQWYKYHIHF